MIASANPCQLVCPAHVRCHSPERPVPCARTAAVVSAMCAAEILGADLAYIGTRFIATQEAMAPEDYKTMLVEGGVTDVIYTSTVKGKIGSASWRERVGH